MSNCIYCNSDNCVICEDCLKKLKDIIHEEDITTMLKVRQTYGSSTKDVLEVLYGAQKTKLLLANQKEFKRLLELNK